MDQNQPLAFGLGEAAMPCHATNQKQGLHGDQGQAKVFMLAHQTNTTGASRFGSKTHKAYTFPTQSTSTTSTSQHQATTVTTMPLQ